MTSGAHVESIDAVREFLAALHTFGQEVCDSVASFDVEVQASVEALTEVEPAFWKHELRRSEEAVSRAKIELERCRASTLPGGDPRSCMEERKQLDRARRKQQFIEEKIEAVRRWGNSVRPQVDEYEARATQLGTVFDSEFPRAVLMLNRVLDALQSYTGVTAQDESRSAVVAPQPSPQPHEIGERESQVPRSSEPSPAARERSGSAAESLEER